MRGDLRITGRLHIEFLNEFGVVERVVETPNRVVAVGLRWIVDLMRGLVYPAIAAGVTNMAIGDGSTAVAATDSALAHETARKSVDETAREEATLYEPSANYTAFFDVGVGTGNVSELALLLSNGQVLARTVIPTQAKSSTTSIRVKWTITLKSA